MWDQDRVNCVGGWSFLLLALGTLAMLPGTIFTGVYIEEKLVLFAIKYVCIHVCVCLHTLTSRAHDRYTYIKYINVYICKYVCLQTTTSSI